MFGLEHVSVVDNFLILAGDNEKRDSKYNQETLNHKLEKKELKKKNFELRKNKKKIC